VHDLVPTTEQIETQISLQLTSDLRSHWGTPYRTALQ